MKTATYIAADFAKGRRAEGMRAVHWACRRPIATRAVPADHVQCAAITRQNQRAHPHAAIPGTLGNNENSPIVADLYSLLHNGVLDFLPVHVCRSHDAVVCRGSLTQLQRPLSASSGRVSRLCRLNGCIRSWQWCSRLGTR